MELVDLATSIHHGSKFLVDFDISIRCGLVSSLSNSLSCQSVNYDDSFYLFKI